MTTKDHDTSVDHFQQGIDFQERGLFDLAIAEYQKALVDDGENLDILVNLGAAYLQKGLPEKSTQALTRALGIHPSHPLALFNLGKAYLYREEPDKALETFEKAAAVMPGDPEVRKSIAQSLLHLDRKDEAVRLLKPLLPQFAGDLALHLLLGRTLIELENHAEALDVFRKAVNLTPDSSEGLEGMIRCQMALDLRDKALTTLKRAMMVDPRNPAFHVTFVDLMIDEGKIDDAIAHLKKTLSTDPNQPELRRKMEELTRRLPVLRKRAGVDLVQKHSPFETQVYDVLDGLYDGKIHLDVAIRKMSDLRGKDPADLFIANELANLYFQARLYDQAVDLYSQIHKSAPEEPRHAINLAKSLALASNLPLAREIVQDACDRMPHDPELPLALVELTLIEKKEREAAILLNRALERHPDNAHGLFLQGFIALRLGDLDQAYTSFQKVLRLTPADEEVAVWYSRLMILRGTPQEATGIWEAFQDGIESLQESLTRVELALAAGDQATAGTLLNRIGDYEPQFIEDEVLFSKAFFYAGDFAEAANRLKKILDQDASHSEALALLAMTFLVKNKPARFWNLWQKSIESDSLPPILLGLTLRKVLNFAQLERLRGETRKLLEITIKDEVDRSRLSAFLALL